MIEVKSVHKYFNKHKKNEIHVIDNTSLKMDKTGLIALLGASGSGKTTLLNVIGGLDKVNKGNIYINGMRITHKSMRKVDKIRNLNIGYIFQDYKLIDDMSVFDNVALVLKMLGIKDKKEIKRRVDFTLNTLNIYRYRFRPAGMLSGGERQRVGIARAIVKDPDILLADEPTGNLDSKNTLEIMNIIKNISKNRLVILVTHEANLASVYADRIIEIEDGKVVKDYKNENDTLINYIVDSKIYLKDIKNHTKITKDNNIINLYNETDKNIDLTIVLRNGNIYLKSNNNEKIEVVDEASNIELINEHYKELSKEELAKYEFNFKDIISTKKKKYSSILNPVTLLINGFKKIINYSFIKKILLLGYMAASMFILFSLARIAGVSNIKDESFIQNNNSYISVAIPKLDINKYQKITNLSGINYAFPGSDKVTFSIFYNTFFQNYGQTDDIIGSIASSKLITSEDIIYGKLPENDNEIVIDKMILSETLENESSLAKMSGINKLEDFLSITTRLDKDYKIVGISDKLSPSIYTNESNLINLLYINYINNNDLSNNPYLDYNGAKITLKRGKMPTNDYEVLINYEERYSYSIGSKLDNKINGEKLKVVGYYTADGSSTNLYVNNNMIKYILINNSDKITISSSDKEST